jgi:ketosteroid isomerase-like protein
MTNNGNEQAIRALIDDWSDAICKGDIDRILSKDEPAARDWCLNDMLELNGLS